MSDQERTARQLQLIDASGRRDLVPLSDVHIWRLEKQGKFPKRVKVGEKRVGWVRQEVLNWIEARMAEREAD